MAKVLVIDDTQEHLSLLKMMLELKGHEVETSLNKDCGVAKLETFKPAIILLDVFLDGHFSGRELCKKIKETNPNIYIVLLSANSKSLQDFKECNADAVIEKPFDISVIFETIDKLMA